MLRRVLRPLNMLLSDKVLTESKPSPVPVDLARLVGTWYVIGNFATAFQPPGSLNARSTFALVDADARVLSIVDQLYVPTRDAKTYEYRQLTALAMARNDTNTAFALAGHNFQRDDLSWRGLAIAEVNFLILDVDAANYSYVVVGDTLGLDARIMARDPDGISPDRVREIMRRITKMHGYNTDRMYATNHLPGLDPFPSAADAVSESSRRAESYSVRVGHELAEASVEIV